MIEVLFLLSFFLSLLINQNITTLICHLSACYTNVLSHTFELKLVQDEIYY